ncbi:MAG: carboxypeptidase-like regulatory domain-containing protein [Betaproteobacteria bacterium]|nr:carboxypeptidase-like regulatory domain-containing protein [Betaproteobacteria bacterium]
MAPTGSDAAATSAKLLPKGTIVPSRYVDQLIDEKMEGVEELGADEGERGPQPEGRRLSAAEARYYHRSSNLGGVREYGVSLQHRRETLDYGDLSIDAYGRDVGGDPALLPSGPTQGAQFQFQQFRMPLTPQLLMDNSAGSVRLGANPLVTHSFRMQLPSSIAEGAQSRVYGDADDALVYAGRVGQLNGIATQSFSATQGDLIGAGYNRVFSRSWAGGVQVAQLSNHALLPDHQSFAWAGRYQEGDKGRQIGIHLLTDTAGGRGGWADGLEPAGLWQHRYGSYRLPQSLLWSDVNIGNDTQGAYLRSDYRTLTNSMSVGGEWSESNLAGDPLRSGFYTRTLYSTGYHRVSRDTNLNGGVTVVDRKAKAALLPAEDSRSASLSAGVGERFAWGASNFRLAWGRTEAVVNYASSRGFTWDHAWNLQAWSLSTALAYLEDDTAGIVSTRKSLAMQFRRSQGRWTYDGGAQYVLGERQGVVSHSLNWSLNGDWAIDRIWSSRLQLNWNRVDVADPLFPALTRENMIMLALRAQDYSGQPYAQFGRRTGAAGSGRIVGWVFYDENGDGVRQASERGAAGVLVYLDGRYSATTDTDGRFEFQPVPVGEHRLRVAIERVPLPWGLLDDTPRRLDVPLRDAASVDLPLTRISQ